MIERAGTDGERNGEVEKEHRFDHNHNMNMSLRAAVSSEARAAWQSQLDAQRLIGESSEIAIQL